MSGHDQDLPVLVPETKPDDTPSGFLGLGDLSDIIKTSENLVKIQDNLSKLQSPFKTTATMTTSDGSPEGGFVSPIKSADVAPERVDGRAGFLGTITPKETNLLMGAGLLVVALIFIGFGRGTRR